MYIAEERGGGLRPLPSAKAAAGQGRGAGGARRRRAQCAASWARASRSPDGFTSFGRQSWGTPHSLQSALYAEETCEGNL
jgi:hypothetical protein